MPRGGKREGAGRKPNAPNKATQERQRKIEATGATPLSVLIRKMRFHLNAADAEEAKGKNADPLKVAAALDKAEEAAKLAAPYVHPRLAAIEHTGAGGGPIQTEDVSARDLLADRIARFAARSGALPGNSKPH